MLVKFHSDAYATITMFGDVGVRLLKLMGHSGTVPGAILAEDVPAALERLKRAVEANKAASEAQGRSSDRADESEDEKVSLANRAYPLIELLEASAKADCDVMWD